MKFIPLLSLVACSQYPQDANLKIVAGSTSYTVYGESQEESYELGMKDNPAWLENVAPELRIRISFKDPMHERVVYEGYFLDEQGERRAPSLPSLLDLYGIIGANCGFHHPDSLDPCDAAVKVDYPLRVSYTLTSFPGEKDTTDNTLEILLGLDELQWSADILSGIWAEQKRIERERQQEESKKHAQGWK